MIAALRPPSPEFVVPVAQWRRRAMPLSLPIVLAASLLLAVAAPEQASADASCPAEVWFEADAIATAVRCGGEVEVASRRGERQRAFATPDSIIREEQTLRPQRKQRADGSWVDLDATLQNNADGTLSPVASTVGLTFSGGGTGPAVTSLVDGRGFGLSFDTGADAPLPTPVVSESTATYSEVLPGVDLRLTADIDGFSHVLVVKSPKAAALPQVRQARWVVAAHGTSVTSTEGGHLTVVDATSQEELLSTGTAVMWETPATEAASEPRTLSAPEQEPDADAEGRVEKVAVGITNDAVTVVPNAEMLADPSTKYPVFIDPTWSDSSQNHWATLTDYNGDYYDTAHIPVNKDAGEVKVGRSPTDGMFKARALFEMSLTSMSNRRFVDAQFRLNQGWSSQGCGGSSATGLYRIPAFSGSTTWATSWNSSGSGWKTRLGTNSEVRLYNSSTCGPRDVEWDATAGVRAAYNEKKSTITLGLKAEDESSTDSWKKYRLDLSLQIRYNSIPGLPANVTVAGKPCVTGADRPSVSDATPAFSGMVTDADGHTITGYVGWKPVGDAWGTSDQLNQGSLKSKNYLLKSPAADLPDGVYSLRMRAKDNPLASEEIGTGDYSGYFNCEFEVDTVRPGAPTAYSTLYVPESESKDGHGGVGITGSFDITAPQGSTDIASYTATLNDAEFKHGVSIRAASPATPLQVTPTSGGPNTLRVWAVDRAGNASADPVVYRFTVDGTYSEPISEWNFDTWDGVSDVPAEKGQLLSKVGAPAVTGGRSRVDKGAGIPGTDNALRTSLPVIDLTKTFTVAAWARLDDAVGNRMVVSQAGTNRPGFYLWYQGTRKKWSFEMVSSDGPTAQFFTVDSIAEAKVGAWTHLMATYDAARGKIALWVNGHKQNEVDRTLPINTTGPLYVGQAGTIAGGMYAPWLGAIDEVKVWDRLVVDNQAAVLATTSRRTGHWTMDGPSDQPEADQIGFGNSLTYSTGVTTDPEGWANFDGTGCATTNAAVLNTEASFSVAAWVRLANKSDHRNILSQTGQIRPSFYLQYNPGFDRWQFNIPASDEASTTFTSIRSQQVPQLNVWTHLAATYDAGTKTTTLFVNGQPEATTDSAVPWNSGGPLKVGCASTLGEKVDYQKWSGGIDDVRIYSGVLSGSGGATDSEQVTVIKNELGRDVGNLPHRTQARNSMIAQTSNGKLVINTVGPDEYSQEWIADEVWRSPDDGYTAQTRVVNGDFNADGLTDAALLRERNEYDLINGVSTLVATRTYLIYLESDGNALSAHPEQLLGSALRDPVTGTMPISEWALNNLSLATGDLDADGDADLVAGPVGADCADAPMKVFIARDNTLSDPITSPNTPAQRRRCKGVDIAMTDVDGDGAADLASFGYEPTDTANPLALTLQKGRGPSALAASTTLWKKADTQRPVYKVNLLDADLNGRSDDLRTNPDTGAPGEGYGDLASFTWLTNGTWQLDVFTAKPDTPTVTATTNRLKPTVPTLYDNATPTFFDVDGDGDDDLVVFYRDATGLSAWLYTNENGTFPTEQQIWTGSEEYFNNGTTWAL